MEFMRVGLDVVTNFQKHLFVFRSRKQLNEVMTGYLDNFIDHFEDVEQSSKDLLCDFINGRKLE